MRLNIQQNYKKENLLNGDGQQFHQYQQNKRLSPQISEN
jgi:hypothetical protein